ncbi:MAG TPA: NAD(P)H-hydrate dehydratase [Rhodocyclaceae bacterium]|jgi:hydroxyethylthiazole kinase-like uncharacterized protein yjeF|nr:NAD(P)H-hydrate dehydratase [Rhodocyclaceae bacterium]
MKLLRSAAIRRIESLHLPHTPLMEHAGLAAADFAAESCKSGTILVVAGSGNNGGDAYVCARHLKARGRDVIVASFAATKSLPADAESARSAWLAGGGKILDTFPAQSAFTFAIDGLFGIGLSRPIEGIAAEWIAKLNALPCPILALDVPSGLDADTGRVMGTCVKAAYTMTFLAAKPGLFTLAGRDHAGTVLTASLDIDTAAERDGTLISRADFSIRPRQHDSHKGTHGNAALIGGATGMAGAIVLSGRAALHLGAGRVYVGMLERLSVDLQQPELMLREVDDVIALATAIGIGPGLGSNDSNNDASLTALKLALAADKPLVIDADALNLISSHPALAEVVYTRTAPTLLTPHPTEAARLLDCSTTEIQKDRIAATQTLARRFNASVVLKGSGSIVATPTGEWFINPTGNGGLATAGSGDVLLGMIVALLAQGMDTKSALLAAVYLHGAAADALVAEGIGPIGLTAGEIIPAARKILNEWALVQ